MLIKNDLFPNVFNINKGKKIYDSLFFFFWFMIEQSNNSQKYGKNKSINGDNCMDFIAKLKTVIKYNWFLLVSKIV